MKRVAVILCGSGYRDGSEIRESVATLWALSQEPVQVQCFAPDAPQADVVNCLTGAVSTGETRNQLIEAARIARGKILPLSTLSVSAFDAIILPGGFGAAKNLCSFASQGASGTVRPELETILKEFHAKKKPIGAICISPAIVGLALKGTPLELTLGAGGETAEEVAKLGHEHFPCEASRCIVDKTNRVVTTPAYMIEQAQLYEIFTGIQKLVREVVKLA